MKINNLLFWLAATGLVLIAFSPSTLAEGGVLPDQLLNKPLKEWQLNGVTILLGIQVLGRIYTALASGGGVVGIFKAIAFGSATAAKPLTALKERTDNPDR